MGIKTVTDGLVEKIEDNWVIFRNEKLDIVLLFIKTIRLTEIEEFPKKLSQQEKDMLINKRIRYIRDVDYSTVYELEILDEPYKNWTITAKL